jgi:hypothetical protein
MTKEKFFYFIYFFSFLIFIFSLFLFGWTETWSHLGVPTMKPIFADLRTVQGAYDSIALGFDPQIANPGDPWNRPLNYSKLWLGIGEIINIKNESNYVLFVSSYVFIYLLSFFNLLKNFPSFFMLICFFSGSSLLAIERGNIDLIIFSLLFTSVFLKRDSFKSLFIFFATILKIYPIFASVIIMKNRKIFYLFTIICLLFLGLNYQEIIKMKDATPISIPMSYGAANISAIFMKYLNLKISSNLIGIFMVALGFLIYRIKFIKTAITMNFSPNKDNKKLIQDLFLIGASIYICSFLLVSNFDYRLIFVILCIPYIDKIKMKFISIFSLIMIVIASNQYALYLFFNIYGVLINIFSKCYLFVFLFLLLLDNFEKLNPPKIFKGLVFK